MTAYRVGLFRSVAQGRVTNQLGGGQGDGVAINDMRFGCCA
jgi:hypothetical protein